MKSCMRNFLERRIGILNELLRTLYDPRRQIQERRMRLDELTIRLCSSVRRKLEVESKEVEALTARLKAGIFDTRNRRGQRPVHCSFYRIGAGNSK